LAIAKQHLSHKKQQKDMNSATTKLDGREKSFQKFPKNKCSKSLQKNFMQLTPVGTSINIVPSLHKSIVVMTTCSVHCYTLQHPF